MTKKLNTKLSPEDFRKPSDEDTLVETWNDCPDASWHLAILEQMRAKPSTDALRLFITQTIWFLCPLRSCIHGETIQFYINSAHLKAL